MTIEQRDYVVQVPDRNGYSRESFERRAIPHLADMGATVHFLDDNDPRVDKPSDKRFGIEITSDKPTEQQNHIVFFAAVGTIESHYGLITIPLPENL